MTVSLFSAQFELLLPVVLMM